MKKIMYLITSVLVLGFTACGSDDDDEDVSNSNECIECSIAKICNNGDNTATISILGLAEEIVDIPEGTTFDEFTTNTEYCSTN